MAIVGRSSVRPCFIFLCSFLPAWCILHLHWICLFFFSSKGGSYLACCSYCSSENNRCMHTVTSRLVSCKVHNISRISCLGFLDFSNNPNPNSGSWHLRQSISSHP